MNTPKKISKITLLITLIVALTLSGCNLIGGSGSAGNKCSAGSACTYYSGTQGLVLIPENLPNTLYYNLEDMNTIDGNSAEFDYRIENRGASYAFGATFIEGFDPNIFKLYKMKDGEWEPIHISQANQACYFDILGFSPNGMGLTAGCYGIDGKIFSPGGEWDLDLDFKKIGQLYFNDPSWPDITLDVSRDAGGHYNIGGNYENVVLNTLIHGEQLMAYVTKFNFEKYGGSIISLAGDNADTPGGEIEYPRFKVEMSKPWPAGQDFIQIPYQIRNCYAYTTFISPMICVDPNPFSAEDKNCRSESYSWGGSQGAPVAVTRMTQTNTGKEVIMEFTIRNVGGGTVWDVGQLEACSPYFPGNVKPTMHDVVYVGNGWIGNQRIDCSRQQNVRLNPNSKDATFTCRYDYTEGEGAGNVGGGYLTPLKMELWYGYEETTKRQLTIRRLG